MRQEQVLEVIHEAGEFSKKFRESAFFDKKSYRFNKPISLKFR
jgi:hypothetical protein